MSFSRRDMLKRFGLGGSAFAGVSALCALSPQTIANEHCADVVDAKSYIRIKDIEIIKLRFDKKTPLTWNAIKKSGGSYPSVKYLKISTDKGISGYSIIKGPESEVKKFAKKLEGMNLLNVEQAWEIMYFENRKPVAKGASIHAIGSVDLAIWDIVGKALRQPVHRLLGTHHETLDVYAAGGYYEKDKGIKELVSEMEGYVNAGHKVVKMKVGGETNRKDAERVKAVRDALGPDIGIMIDANNGFRSAYQAIRFGRMVEDLDLYWFEEPVIPYDWKGNAECRKELDTPITAGENEYTRWGALDLLSHRACDIINMDTIKAGGITEMRKIAAVCSAFHVPVAPHGYAHMNMHVLASLPNALILETYPEKARDFNPALAPFDIINGQTKVPMNVGLGMEPDPSLVKKYRV